jgi:hypothetical protein
MKKKAGAAKKPKAGVGGEIKFASSNTGQYGQPASNSTKKGKK